MMDHLHREMIMALYSMERDWGVSSLMLRQRLHVGIIAQRTLEYAQSGSSRSKNPEVSEQISMKKWGVCYSATAHPQEDGKAFEGGCMSGAFIANKASAVSRSQC